MVALHTPASLFLFTVAGAVIVGFSLSVTTTVNDLISSPQLLDAFAYTVVVPTGNVYGFAIVEPKFVKLYVIVGDGVPEFTVIFPPKVTDAPQVPASLLKGPRFSADLPPYTSKRIGSVSLNTVLPGSVFSRQTSPP